MSDRVDPVAHLQKAARPSRYTPESNGALRGKAPTPVLPTPAIARPTVWGASQMSFEEVLTSLYDLEIGAGFTRTYAKQQVFQAETLLGWLLGFPGESWQQRWHASGADAAAKGWTSLVTVPGARRDYLVASANKLLLLDVVRPDYSWLYGTNATYRIFKRFRSLRDPDGFARIEALCDANGRLQSTDRRFAVTQLVRILMHNGGTLAEVTMTDCIEAYRAQEGYAARLHSLWYSLLIEAGILPQDSPPTI